MAGSFVDEIVDFFLPLFTTWGYLIVFAGAFLESIFITGWIAPGTAVLLLGSFYAAQGGLNIFLVALFACLGAFAGDNVGYFIGVKGGEWLQTRYRSSRRLRRGIERTQGYFKRYGGATVLFGRLVSGVDAFIPVSAGIGGMRYLRYIAFDIPGIFIWTGILCSLGYFFGDNWETIDDFVGYIGWAVLGVVVLIFLVVYLLKRFAARRRTVEEGEDEITE